jgi:hypothetical protein
MDGMRVPKHVFHYAPKGRRDIDCERRRGDDALRRREREDIRITRPVY